MKEGKFNMTLNYIPTEKIIIDTVSIQFNDNRSSIRTRLSMPHTEDNQIIQLSDLDTTPIVQRRDIYKNINFTDNYFFLGYNEDDLLNEIEIHFCEKINVFDITFDFNDSIEAIKIKLRRYSSVIKRDDGEYFFKELKAVIMNQDRMGGEGNDLAYFYCASDVTHLMD